MLRRRGSLRWLVVVGALAWILHRSGTWAQLGVEPEPEAPVADYQREDWPHWIDEDGDCQDTRQEVLIAESEIPVRFAKGARCKVVSGRWRCPYTGRVFTDPRRLDVDHRVPLHEAHRSGGDAWGRERRQRYANDLTDPAHLVAVHSGANRAKGDKAPDAWMPTDPGDRCEYLREWVRVKDRWGLRMDPVERSFVERGQQACDRGEAPPLPVGQRRS